MKIIFRLIKVLLVICLIPITFITSVIGHLIIPIALGLIDLFKYIFTGNAVLLKKYMCGDDSDNEIFLPIQKWSYVWVDNFIEWYNKKILDAIR